MRKTAWLIIVIGITWIHAWLDVKSVLESS